MKALAHEMAHSIGSQGRESMVSQNFDTFLSKWPCLTKTDCRSLHFFLCSWVDSVKLGAERVTLKARGISSLLAS